MSDDLSNVDIGREFKKRREALGWSVARLARESDVYRARVKALEDGDPSVTGATVGKLRSTLKRLEETKPEGEKSPSRCEVIITLPDGVQVEFLGTSDQVLDWTLDFLAGREIAPAQP